MKSLILATIALLDVTNAVKLVMNPSDINQLNSVLVTEGGCIDPTTGEQIENGDCLAAVNLDLKESETDNELKKQAGRLKEKIHGRRKLEPSMGRKIQTGRRIENVVRGRKQMRKNERRYKS